MFWIDGSPAGWYSNLVHVYPCGYILKPSGDGDTGRFFRCSSFPTGRHRARRSSFAPRYSIRAFWKILEQFTPSSSAFAASHAGRERVFLTNLLFTRSLIGGMNTSTSTGTWLFSSATSVMGVGSGISSLSCSIPQMCRPRASTTSRLLWCLNPHICRQGSCHWSCIDRYFCHFQNRIHLLYVSSGLRSSILWPRQYDI